MKWLLKRIYLYVKEILSYFELIKLVLGVRINEYKCEIIF